ncbi:MAG: bifunctional serine/threonine-protein kinase/formylglycine-generating enzyme family protein [Planctomycetota bacterium]
MSDRGESPTEPASTAAPATPDHVGPYRVVRVLGEGGMGVVYLAEQSEPVERRVAVKVVRSGLGGHELLARFEFERQALAAMNHSSIAKVLDAGTMEGGEPYFVMEWVEGPTLGEYCADAHPDLRARLDLFRVICDGVHHAHQKGVIHRDLKPGNILIVREGGRAVPKILDFGVAKATGTTPGDEALTIEPQILGTPEYMSPEQASLDGGAVDTRSDVYSLGVILFELLTGRVPFAVSESSGKWLDFQRRLLHDDPPLPSSAVTRHARAEPGEQGATTRGLHRLLRGDLDWIVTKALAKEPERRYESAAELAADVRRFQRFEPVLAGPPTTGYRLRKFLRRRRGLVASAAIVAFTLLAGIVSTTSLLFEVDARAAEAQANLDRFELLAHVVEHDDALIAADELFPAWPERAAALRRWLDERGDPLARALPGLRGTRDAMTAAAATEFGEAKDEQFLRETLDALVGDLEAFVAPKTGTLAAIQERLEWADGLEQRSIVAPTEAWAAARTAVGAGDGETASALYAGAGIDLTPQLGLVPIGMNPNTGLWEFHHLRSAEDPGALPTRGDDGEVEFDEGTGIVFVLLPPGRVTVAGKASDVAPFFLGKHEVTQAQWVRLARADAPNYYGSGFEGEGMTEPVDGRHPVENVDWFQSDRLLRQHGLRLPDEPRWEHGCRAGTTTRWFTGNDAESLAYHANVADATAAAVWEWQGRTMPFEDGFVIHAPVGSLAPNPWGLYDMIGNVWEWCENEYNDEYGVCRGGNFSVAGELTTSEYRYWIVQTSRDGTIGLRAARDLGP